MVCYQEFPDFTYEIPVGHKSFPRHYYFIRDFAIEASKFLILTFQNPYLYG